MRRSAIGCIGCALTAQVLDWIVRIATAVMIEMARVRGRTASGPGWHFDDWRAASGEREASNLDHSRGRRMRARSMRQVAAVAAIRVPRTNGERRAEGEFLA